MNKLRDFIYDKSDIVVALLIISIAGLVVFSRIDAILSYPETFAANMKPTVISTPAVYVEKEGTASSGAIEKDKEDADNNNQEVEMFAIYINYGESLQSVADKFVSVQLYETSEEFLAVIEEAGVQTQIKTGNFVIPENATDEEIIKIITRPGL